MQNGIIFKTFVVIILSFVLVFFLVLVLVLVP
jgi:hypothetical protein